MPAAEGHTVLRPLAETRRISSLAAGHVVKAVHDGTRFLLGSVAAAVLSAGAVEFTASNAACRVTLCETECLALLEGGGTGGLGGEPAAPAASRLSLHLVAGTWAWAETVLRESGGFAPGGLYSVASGHRWVNPQDNPSRRAMRSRRSAMPRRMACRQGRMTAAKAMPTPRIAISSGAVGCTATRWPGPL